MSGDLTGLCLYMKVPKVVLTNTYATFILALCTIFFGLTRLNLASSLGGGLMASDHSLPKVAGN